MYKCAEFLTPQDTSEEDLYRDVLFYPMALNKFVKNQMILAINEYDFEFMKCLIILTSTTEFGIQSNIQITNK